MRRVDGRRVVILRSVGEGRVGRRNAEALRRRSGARLPAATDHRSITSTGGPRRPGEIAAVRSGQGQARPARARTLPGPLQWYSMRFSSGMGVERCSDCCCRCSSRLRPRPGGRRRRTGQGARAAGARPLVRRGEALRGARPPFKPAIEVAPADGILHYDQPTGRLVLYAWPAVTGEIRALAVARAVSASARRMRISSTTCSSRTS